MENEIIEHYKQSGSYLATWRKFAYRKISQRQIRKILRDAGVLKPSGKHSEEEFKVIPDYKNYFTDKDFDFEDEIATAVFK